MVDFINIYSYELMIITGVVWGIASLWLVITIQNRISPRSISGKEIECKSWEGNIDLILELNESVDVKAGSPWPFSINGHDSEEFMSGVNLLVYEENSSGILKIKGIGVTLNFYGEFLFKIRVIPKIWDRVTYLLMGLFILVFFWGLYVLASSGFSNL